MKPDSTNMRLEIELTTGVWTNFLNKTTSINIKRREMEVGTMNAVIRDAAVDPAQATNVRPGKGVRVHALSNGVWEPIFVGVLRQAHTTYERGGTLTVTLQATDKWASLASSPVLGVPRNFLSATHIAEAAAKPYNIDNYTTTWGSPLDVASTDFRDERMTALDALGILRDNVKGYMWFNRAGVFCMSLHQTFYSTQIGSGYSPTASDTYKETTVARNYHENPRLKQHATLGPTVTAGTATVTYLTGGGIRIVTPPINNASTPIRIAMPQIHDENPLSDGEGTTTGWYVNYDAKLESASVAGKGVNVTAGFYNSINNVEQQSGPDTLYADLNQAVRRQRILDTPNGNVNWWMVISNPGPDPVSFTFTLDKFTVNKAYDELGTTYNDGATTGWQWEGTPYFSRSNGPLPADRVYTKDISFTDIDVGFDSTSLINVINVKQVLGDAPNHTENLYQFYDQNSINQWGARSLDVVLSTPNVTNRTYTYPDTTYTYEQTVAAWANALLAERANPKVTVSSIKFAVTTGNTRQAAATMELFRAMQVRYGTVVPAANFRTKGIEHVIRPGKWIVTVDFQRGADGVAWD